MLMHRLAPSTQAPGPPALDGEHDPDAGSASSILSTDTSGDANENELRILRPDRIAVATKGSPGTKLRRTLS